MMDTQEQMYPRRKPRLTRAEYATHYRRGWSARQLDEMAYAFRHSVGLFGPEVDAYVDGYLDAAHGLRGKWHMRDCVDHPACGHG